MTHHKSSETRTSKQRILVVGGVAGGASCAARARRLSEEAEIIVFERGPYVSFANCGLPYYIGDVIPQEQNLILATPELFKNRFNIEIRTENDVLKIDRPSGEIEVKNLKTGKVYRERYDTLVLSPGSAPIRPPLPGINLPGIFSLRTIPDSRQIKEWIARRKAMRAVIVGGGFIGLEMADNLVNLGLSVAIVEKLSQVLPVVDPEMAAPVHQHLAAKGVSLYLGDGVAGFESDAAGRITVATESGKKHVTDLVILAIGVRPENTLAKEAGLEIGSRGGIRVDDRMRTSDEHIMAVGDAVEVRDFITGEWTLIPLAGSANRQGRIAADVIFGRDSRFRGVQGTAVCKVFDMTVACTGANERTLQRSGPGGKPASYEKIYLHPAHHVGYYPGAKSMGIKLLFSKGDGKILGAQALGEEGVEKRIDVIAMAIQRGSTVFDLEEAELCYAPQFGSAKDPVNFAGMIAANSLRGDTFIVHSADVGKSDALILDVRTPLEFDSGHIEGAVNIPLAVLRERLSELPHDREIVTYCAVGQRSYYASRILRLNGFNARGLSGGFQSYQVWKSGNG